MLQRTNAKAGPLRIQSYREWLVVIFGLGAGLLIGAAILREGSAVEQAPPRNVSYRSDAQGARIRNGAPRRVEPSSASWDRGDEPPRETSAADDELDTLKRRIAELEKKKLQQRLAALEAELEERDEAPDVPARRAAPAPKRASASTAATDASETHPQRSSVRERVAATHPTPPAVLPSATLSSREPRPATAPASKTLPPKSPTGEATLVWWNAVNDVIAREGAMPAAPANVTAANAGGFVEARAQAGRFASESIGALGNVGVDPDALGLGRDLVAWYREEIELAERAKALLGSNDIAGRKGSAGNAWKGDEESHRRKCDEVNRRGAELRARLSRTYGLAFPALN